MAKNILKAIGILLIVCFVVGMSGCADSESKDRKVVQSQQEHYGIVQPVPYYDWSLERQTMIEVYNARNDEIATHSVWRSDYGIIEGDCASIGYPIPYDVQLTNGLQPAYTSSNGAVIEQAEPNGLFSSKTTSATWIRAVYKINGKAVQVPIYVEGKVTCYPFPVEVDYTTNRVTPVKDAQPSVRLSNAKGDTSPKTAPVTAT